MVKKRSQESCSQESCSYKSCFYEKDKMIMIRNVQEDENHRVK